MSALWAVVVLIAIVVTYYLAMQDKAVSISIAKDGNLVLEVKHDDSFIEVFENALETDGTSVDAILASKDYYNLTNPDFVDALANIDVSQPGNKEVSKRLRNLLWDLRGPFSVPGTLRGADERMVKALDDLDEALQNAAEASDFLAALWELTLDRKGIFKTRFFKAKVEIVQHVPTGDSQYEYVFTCPGSGLVSGWMLSLYTGEGNIWAEATQNPSVLDCGGSALTTGQLLAGGTARLGVSETTFRQLVDPTGTSGIGDGRSDAKFELFPRGLISRFQ